MQRRRSGQQRTGRSKHLIANSQGNLLYLGLGGDYPRDATSDRGFVSLVLWEHWAVHGVPTLGPRPLRSCTFGAQQTFDRQRTVDARLAFRPSHEPVLTKRTRCLTEPK